MKTNLINYQELLSELLKELPLYIFYEKIHRELSNNGANDNFAECNTKLLSTDPKESKLLKLCKSFHNVFSKASELNLYFKESSFNTSCFQMNLLLYSKVISITEESNIIDKFYKALQTISKVSISDKKFCDIKNYEYRPEKFKKMKYLYEFLFTYYDIYQKITLPRNNNYQLYCNHIKENFRLYNSIKKNCPELDKCPYKNELRQIKQNVDEYINLSEICSKCNYEPTTCKENSNEANDIPCLKEKVSTLALPITNPDPDNVVNQITKVLTYSVPSVATFTILYKVKILFFLLKYDNFKTSCLYYYQIIIFS
ncbi:hypothetical protein PVNG_05838 [Plasmodium vivax North Korean]|uniref:Variable surface protein n=1 Tax=Plasmodium vivax North Korean TaxID=1035514 RepID=A0A0J9TL76_PLAVI|nr:hypothetical protein PVNG_05838 [Plasmodium vivax North Korean]